MGRLDSNALLATSLNNNEPFLYAHLVKFERPLAQIKELPNGEIRYETDATRYAYITDAAYDINFDDGSTNLAGTANGTQIYRANKLLKAGSVSESTAIKIASMNLQLNAAGVDASITGTFNITSAGVITVTNGLGFVEAGFQEGDRVKFSLGNNSTKYLRLTSFYTVSGNPVAQASLLTLKDSSGNNVSITSQTGFSSTLSLESDEIVALLRETIPTNFVNRKVFIYKGFLETESPNTFIGNPVLLFKGIITTASYKEDGNKAVASWGVKSHWGDFKQVRGRLTSDDFHRALKPNSKGQLVGNPQATIRPEYANDKGFAHAEQAVNVIGTYMTKETKIKMKKRGGISGWLFGAKKAVEYEVDVEREVDLRFDLQAKYLPIVYGVQRMNGNLIFADTSATDAGQVFVGEALCEGPIHGIYNIYVEDSSIICVDKPDADVREGGGDAVDIVCFGRTDKGIVMGNNNTASSVALGYKTANDDSGVLDWLAENSITNSTLFFTGPLGGALKIDYSQFTSNVGTTGLTHDSGFKIDVPTTVDVEFKAGKADQRTSRILLTQAHGDQFKLEKDYWGTEGSGDYWSESHQLLDTAYVVTRNSLSEEQSDIPDLEYVIKGKILDCYNYDGSFTHNPTPAYTSEDFDNFILGEEVDIKNSSDTIIAENVIIIDKWFHDAGDYGGYRFRWNLTAAEETLLNSTKSFYMTDGTNNWHMLTHDYETTGVTVAETLSAAVTSVETTGDNDLEVIVANATAEFETVMATSLLTDGQENMLGLINTTTSASLGSIFETTYNASTNRVTFNGSKSTGVTSTDTAVIITNKIAITGGNASSTDDYYNGATIIITKTLEDGNELDITKIVKDYDGASKTITTTGLFSIILNDDYIPMFPEEDDKITIIMGHDKRVSTNPALITYDYLTSKRYGPGIEKADINQNSFLNAGVTCDTGSDITVTLSSSQSFTKDAVYKWVSGVFKWQGTVKTTGSGTSVTFTDCIGKLTNKWNNWETKKVGDLVWTHVGSNKQLYRMTSEGFQSTGHTNGATSQETTFTLAKVSGTGSNLTVAADGGNPVLYTLYDHDEIKFWKYLGWESHDQRWVTRHQTNMIIKTEQPVFNNISALLEHFNGLLTYADGKYTILVETAKDEATEGTDVFNDDNSDLNIKIRFITDEDIIGAINIKDKGLSKSFNSLSASINDPQNNFNGRAVSFFNSDYLKKDRGIVKSTNFKMPGITNYFNARMAVKQILDQSRFNREISFTMRPAGLAMMCGELIRIQYPRFGWNDGKYWRIKNLTLNENCLINVVAEEYEDEVYLVPSAADTPFRINTSTEAVTRAPSAPTSLTGTTGGTEVIGQINVSWTAHATSPPTATSGRYEIWRADAQSGNVATKVTDHATKIADVGGSVVAYVDKPQVLSGTFYYWVRAANHMPIQTTSGRELKSYYSDFTSNSNSGVVGSTISIQQVSLVAEDYSVVYDTDGANPTFTDANSDGKILFTATAQGFISPQFRFVVAGTQLQAWSTTATASWTVPSTIFSPSKVVEVQVREGGAGSAAQTDSTSIMAVQPGTVGNSAAEVSVYAITSAHFATPNTPTGGAYTFASTPSLTTVPTSSTSGGAPAVTWFSTVPPNTNPIYNTQWISQTTASAVPGEVDSSLTWTAPTAYLRGQHQDFIFIRASSQPSTPSNTEPPNIPSGWHTDTANAPGTATDPIWTSLGVLTKTGSGPQQYMVWGAASQIEGTDGTDSYTVVMTNEAHTVPVTTTGTVGFTGSGTHIEVFKGATEQTGIITGTAGSGQFKITGRSVSPSGFFDTSGSDDSGLGAISQAAGSLKHLVVADFDEVNGSLDTGTVTYTIDIGGTQEVTKKQTITKSKEGDEGLQQISATTIRYSTPSASTPSTPTATSYTFSTNAFVGLTTNWTLGDVSITGSNANNFWESTFTAIENSTRANSSSGSKLTFTAPSRRLSGTGALIAEDHVQLGSNVQDSGGNVLVNDDVKNTAIELTPGGALTGAGGGTITKGAVGIPTIFRQDGVPTSLVVGDIWVDTNDGYKTYIAKIAGANEVTSTEWVQMGPGTNVSNFLSGSLGTGFTDANQTGFQGGGTEGRLSYNQDGGGFLDVDIYSSGERTKLDRLRLGKKPDSDTLLLEDTTASQTKATAAETAAKLQESINRVTFPSNTTEGQFTFNIGSTGYTNDVFTSGERTKLNRLRLGKKPDSDTLLLEDTTASQVKATAAETAAKAQETANRFTVSAGGTEGTLRYQIGGGSNLGVDVYSSGERTKLDRLRLGKKPDSDTLLLEDTTASQTKATAAETAAKAQETANRFTVSAGGTEGTLRYQIGGGSNLGVDVYSSGERTKLDRLRLGKKPDSDTLLLEDTTASQVKATAAETAAKAQESSNRVTFPTNTEEGAFSYKIGTTGSAVQENVFSSGERTKLYNLRQGNTPLDASKSILNSGISLSSAGVLAGGAAGTQQITKTGVGIPTVFSQDGIPTSTAIGDMWVDTNDGNKTYRAKSVGANEISATEWVVIGAGTDKANIGLSNVANETRATILGGNLTGTVNSVAVATVSSGAASGATANQDSTSSIRAGTTAANVGLGNVTNESKATMLTSPAITGTPTGVSKTHVGLANVANETRATILGGNLTGTVNSIAVATVSSGAAAGATANQDSTSTILGGELTGTLNATAFPMKAMVTGANAAAVKTTIALNNVDNSSAATIQAGTTKANVGLSNVANETRATILAGNITGTVNSVAVATVTSGAALGTSSNQDSTSSIRAGTTKANVGLSNVANETRATILGGELTGTLQTTAFPMKAMVTGANAAAVKTTIALNNVANENRATILGGNLTGTVNSVAAATVTGKVSNLNVDGDIDDAITIVNGGTIEAGTDSNNKITIDGTNKRIDILDSGTVRVRIGQL